MSSIPRVPRDMDPRRPHSQKDNEPAKTSARSYGQSAEPPKRDHDDIDDFEDFTDEPVREGDDAPVNGPGAERGKKKRDLREFEELAGEPVLDEDTEKE